MLCKSANILLFLEATSFSMVNLNVCKNLKKKMFVSLSSHTDKKKKIFIIYKEIQNGTVAYMRKGFLIYEEMCKYLTIYEEAVCHIWLCNCSILNVLIRVYEKFFFSFLQCCGCGSESGSTGSTCFWDSWIRIRIHYSEVWIQIRIRLRIRIWILLSPSKNSKKNLDSLLLCDYFWLFIFEKDVSVSSKSN